MSQSFSHRTLRRRGLLALGGGALAAVAGVQLAPRFGRGLSLGADSAEAAASPTNLKLVGTDGWIYLPGSVGSVQPDTLAPKPRTTYIFGFRDVTALDVGTTQAQKNRAQASAPLIYVDEMTDVRLSLTNLGLAQRPDLVDSHTIHFHGFRNAIPLFDGVPEMSIAVPIGREFTYYYKPRDPGTYMYHCHFEDVEHIQMGMTGVIFVRPRQNQGGIGIPVARSAGGPASSPLGYVYNDGVAPGQARSTAYDREFVIFLTEVWADAHWRDAHIQVSDWSDYAPDYWLMNGRVYPDTIEPNYDPMVTPTATPAGDSPAERLQFQPISSLVKANAQERVLLRFVNLGYRQAAMTLPGLPMRVVGKDATLLRGRDGTDNSYLTNTVYVGPGESTDAIFTAQNTGTYRLYNRDYAYLSNAGASGLGGQLTEIRISAANSLPLQTVPQT